MGGGVRPRATSSWPPGCLLCSWPSFGAQLVSFVQLPTTLARQSAGWPPRPATSTPAPNPCPCPVKQVVIVLHLRAGSLRILHRQRGGIRGTSCQSGKAALFAALQAAGERRARAAAARESPLRRGPLVATARGVCFQELPHARSSPTRAAVREVASHTRPRPRRAGGTPWCSSAFRVRCTWTARVGAQPRSEPMSGSETLLGDVESRRPWRRGGSRTSGSRPLGPWHDHDVASRRSPSHLGELSRRAAADVAEVAAVSRSRPKIRAHDRCRFALDRSKGARS